MKLNLGCGREMKQGWVNLDVVRNHPEQECVFDLETCATNALPFEESSVEEFFASHVLEHIHNLLPMMQELHRVAQSDASFVTRLPYGSSDDAWEDPTHVRPFFINSFGYFSQPFYWRADYGYRGDWHTSEVTLYLASHLSGRPAPEVQQAIMQGRNAVLEMEVELRAVKPIREPKRELQRPPNIKVVMTK